MNSSLKHFIEQTNAAPSPRKVIEILKTYTLKYGCEFLAFGPITQDSHKLMLNVDPDLPYITNYPDSWVKRYKEKNYVNLDPVLKYAAIANHAFSWKELRSKSPTSKKIEDFWLDAENHGLVCGISVPLHGPVSYGFVFSIASSKPYRCSACMNLDEIQTVAYQFYLAYTSNSINSSLNSEEQRLTSREKEILYWTAKGKSAWDIGMILNISENTVNFHLKNSIKKLGVLNKVAAAVKAIRLGIISF